jgi:two-component system NtrC family sensor kinase
VKGVTTVFDIVVEPIRDLEGRLTGLTVMAADITEHKRSEQALARYAAEIRDLYDRAPCGYHSVNPQGLLVEVNETALRWLGYERAEVLGRMRFGDVIAPEDADRYRGAFE